MYYVTPFLLGVISCYSRSFFAFSTGTPKRNGVTEHMGFFLEIGSNILDFLYSKVAKANY